MVAYTQMGGLGFLFLAVKRGTRNEVVEKNKIKKIERKKIQRIKDGNLRISLRFSKILT